MNLNSKLLQLLFKQVQFFILTFGGGLIMLESFHVALQVSSVDVLLAVWLQWISTTVIIHGQYETMIIIHTHF